MSLFDFIYISFLYLRYSITNVLRYDETIKKIKGRIHEGWLTGVQLVCGQLKQQFSGTCTRITNTYFKTK